MNAKQNKRKRKVSNSNQRNNYQDKAMVREKAKGFREGEELDDSQPHSKFPSKVIGNDPRWYFKDEKILNDVASFSYSTPLGTDIRDRTVYAPTASNAFSSAGLTSIPGLMAIELALTPGIATDAQDPVNLAAQNIYTFDRYKNSGHANYDSPDLMMYLLAMDSAYACWNWLKRIYGYASTYSQTNRYKPRAYAHAEYVDLDDVYANLADFRAYLNMAAGRLSAFCVPAVMTYYVRHSWLFSNIWKDSETNKAQEYMYVPSYFYKYDETSSPTGGKLVPMNVLFTPPATKYKVTDLTGFMDEIINALQYSEDIGIMSGDLLKAYGESNLFTVSTFEADYRVDAAYHRGVLSQIENSMPAGFKASGIAQFTITQDPDTNYIQFQPKLTVAGTSWNERNGFHLNFHWSNPTAEDVIEATRLMWSAHRTGDTLVMDACGSEVPLTCTIYYYSQQGFLNTNYVFGAPAELWRFTIAQQIAIGDMSSAAEVSNLCKQVVLMNAFDWSPEWRIYYVYADGGVNKSYILPPIKDWDVYTRLDNGNIQSLHLLALLSEFNVPE